MADQNSSKEPEGLVFVTYSGFYITMALYGASTGTTTLQGLTLAEIAVAGMSSQSVAFLSIAAESRFLNNPKP